ncbi:hypothetical protein Bbelb_167960 [Branchiostoma belcheri]|nr:hypothetical protein Bbelb_167960 [Branchiostoma belcheri]
MARVWTNDRQTLTDDINFPHVSPTPATDPGTPEKEAIIEWSSDGLTALHQAALDGNIDFVKLLVRHGAKVNCQDEDGWTPLHAAVAEGHPQVARFLIRSGARRSVRNADGDTPEELVEEEDAEMESVFREEVEGVEGAIGEADEEGALGGEEENGGAVEWSDSAGISVEMRCSCHDLELTVVKDCRSPEHHT